MRIIVLPMSQVSSMTILPHHPLLMTAKIVNHQATMTRRLLGERLEGNSICSEVPDRQMPLRPKMRTSSANTAQRSLQTCSSATNWAIRPYIISARIAIKISPKGWSMISFASLATDLSATFIGQRNVISHLKIQYEFWVIMYLYSSHDLPNTSSFQLAFQSKSRMNSISYSKKKRRLWICSEKSSRISCWNAGTLICPKIYSNW